jgi:rod shape-determining protein MreD
MAVLIAVPILGALILLESAIFSQVRLLYGSTDLVLLALIAWAVQERVKTAWQWSLIAGLLVGIVSALPLPAIMAGYLLATGSALVLKRVFWQRPFLAMIGGTFVATLITHALAYGALRFNGIDLSLLESINLVTLPSALLNLLLAILAYALMGDLANSLYPEEIEI